MNDDYTINLLRAIHDAVYAGVPRIAIGAAIGAVLDGECNEDTATLMLRRMADAERRPAS